VATEGNGTTGKRLAKRGDILEFLQLQRETVAGPQFVEKYILLTTKHTKTQVSYLSLFFVWTIYGSPK